ncbi:MAG TPA: hypothetical protein VE088_01200 [Gaiellaceae bacterium]|jgi:hypothetical protein|nr:hypothetical protein [Gaiellaceae bacterium]
MTPAGHARLLAFSGGHFLLGHEQQIRAAITGFVAASAQGHAGEAR